MNSHTVTTSTARAADNPDLKPLIQFVTVAVPVGWVLLTIPFLLDLPVEPFVLGTLFLGLVLPTVVLTRRDPTASMRQLLRDTVRPPRPLWLLLPAALVIPGAVAAVAALLGVGVPLTASFVANLAVMNVLSSLVVVNLWEEMAWAGFVQRRAMARWGFAGGSVATALAFTGVHLPLSLYGADGISDVAYNIAVMVVSGIGMRLVIGAFDGWGHRSILALALIHATFNASSQLLDPGSEWVRYAVTFGLGLGAWALHRKTTTSWSKPEVTMPRPADAAPIRSASGHEARSR